MPQERQHRERQPRRRGRATAQTRTHLSREQVVRAALAIVDRDGLDGFSMRKLGAELGVDPMAAYYYFPNKAAVLDGIVDAVYAEIPPLSGAEAPWDSRLRELMRAWRQVLRAHPHALPVLSTHPPSTPLTLQQEETAVAILYNAGFPPLEAFQAMSCLAGYVIGVAFAEVGVQPGGVPDPTEEEIREGIAQLSADVYPALTAAFRGGIWFDPDAWFEAGLDLFITGLKARHDAIARGADAITSRSA